jgi:DNA-binding transcriptional ArsR family regulator
VTRLCRSGPASIAGLTEGSGVTRQAVAKHLRILEGAGLVRATRSGARRAGSSCPAASTRRARASSGFAQQWDAALERLRAFVEEP